MINHIIWDLDGTLINSEPEIIEHLTIAVKNAGIVDEQKIAEFRIGPTLDKVINTAYKEVTPEQMSLAVQSYRSSYDNCGFIKTFPFSGIEEILSLKVSHHIITNKPSFATSQVIERLNWNNKFVSIRSPYQEDGNVVSKSRLFKDLINEFQIDTQQVIGIGDMATDAIAAKDNGIFAIGVTWGTGIEHELIDVCDIIVNSVEKLNSYICQNV